MGRQERPTALALEGARRNLTALGEPQEESWAEGAPGNKNLPAEVHPANSFSLSFH